MATQLPASSEVLQVRHPTGPISTMGLLNPKGILRQHLVHSFPCGLKLKTKNHVPQTLRNMIFGLKFWVSLSTHHWIIHKNPSESTIIPWQSSPKKKHIIIYPMTNLRKAVCQISSNRNSSWNPRNPPWKFLKICKISGLHPTPGRFHLRLSWPPRTQNCLDGLEEAEISTYILNIYHMYIYVYI